MEITNDYHNQTLDLDYKMLIYIPYRYYIHHLLNKIFYLRKIKSMYDFPGIVKLNHNPVYG